MSNIAILSDSYLNDHRVKANIKNNKLELVPHKRKDNKARFNIVNLSEGGLTWKKLFEDKDKLKEWILAVPICTILHLGAVDIASQEWELKEGNSPIGRNFVKKVEANLTFLYNFVANTLGGKAFQLWKNRHTFVLAQIPDWNNFVSNRPRTLTPEKFRQIRRKANHELKRHRGKLWAKYSCMTVHPHINIPRMEGVHYDKKTQFYYVQQIVEATKKIVCSCCRPDSTASNKKIAQRLSNTVCVRNSKN